MIEVLQFIFSSFWVWCGTVVLLGVAVSPFAMVIEAITRRKSLSRSSLR